MGNTLADLSKSTFISFRCQIAKALVRSEGGVVFDPALKDVCSDNMTADTAVLPV